MSQSCEPSRLATMSFAPLGEDSPPEATARRTLLVIEEGSSFVYRLPESGEIIIGRAKEAQLRLTDQAVSRQHARLSLRADGALLEDLGSHNGVLVNGERIETPHELSSGDVISICGVKLVFARPLLRPIHDSLIPLRSRLEEEVARATQTHRAVSVVVLHLDSSVNQRRALLVPALSRVLRLMDTVAWEGEARLWVLLPELDEQEVRAMATALLAATGPLAAQARAGTATCPADGFEADVLLAGARAALAAALPGEVHTAATTLTTLRIGERSILVADPAMLRLYALIERLATGELTVLIHGETGTGKELAAQALHAYSKRHAARLVSINCATLPESLAESELFGHDKGAYSGALTSKSGFIEAAHGGTLFLDEVGELSPAIQAKLLRVLDTGKLIRVGEVRERSVEVRIVAATHRDLVGEVAAGRFREDLYFRLSGAVLTLPPLRERPRELPLLARSFLTAACERAGRPPLIIAPATMERLLRHRWPGNVRELRNVMEYTATVVTEALLEPEHLPPGVRGNPTASGSPAAPQVLSRVEASPAADSAPTPAMPALPTEPTPQDLQSLLQTARSILRTEVPNKLEAIEEALIHEALAFTAGNKTAAARLLGTHRKVIERRMDKFAPPAPKES